MICTLAISNAIRDVADMYVALYNLSGPSDINHGMCEDFAEDICRLVCGAEAYWDDELGDCDDFGSHKIIKYNEMYYDSECPGGTVNWKELLR